MTKTKTPAAGKKAANTVPKAPKAPKAETPKILTGQIEPPKSDVLSMAEITAMKPPEKQTEAGRQASLARSAFAALGKLRFAMEDEIEKSQANTNITSILRGVTDAAGKRLISDGTISNTGYAAKVWKLVADGFLTEPEYDSLCFAEAFQICKAMSKKSIRPLGGEEVAIIFRANPDAVRDEMESIAARGLTVAEVNAENERVHKAVEAAAAKGSKDAAGAAAASEFVDAAKTGNPGMPTLVNEPAPEVVAGTPAPEAGTPAPAPEVVAGTPAPATGTPGNVVNMPNQGTPEKTKGQTAPKTKAATVTEAEVMTMIDGIEIAIGELAEDEQLRCADRLSKLAEALAELTTAPKIEAPAPAPKGGKKKAA